MPSEPVFFQSDTTIKLRDNLSISRPIQLLTAQGLPYNLSGRVFKLLITDDEDEAHEIAGGVLIQDELQGKLSVLFEDAARAIVGIDDGNHKWLLVEFTDNGKLVHQEGWVNRATISQA